MFFTSFHEFVLLVKEKIRERRGLTPDPVLDTDGEVPLTELHEQEGTLIYSGWHLEGCHGYIVPYSRKNLARN